MAQTANINPVILERDNSIQYLGQTLQNIAKQKRDRQLATQEALLKQRSANDAIFGSTSKEIRDYYDKSKSLSSIERDRILQERMQQLAKIPRDSPEFMRAAVQITNEASSAFNGINKTFSDTEAVIEDLNKSGLKINPEAVRRLATNQMYEYSTEGPDNTNILEGLRSGVLEPIAGMSREDALRQAAINGKTQVKKLKAPGQLQDFGLKLKEEIISHPELYVDRSGVKEAAFTEVDKILTRAKPAGSKLTLDPTGTKTSMIGTDYTLSIFDTEEDLKDNVTGLGYKKPKLNVTKVDGLYYNGGDSADVLGEEQFVTLMNSGKNVRQEVMVGALENIREHNVEVFRRAGVPNAEAIALSVSKNNATQFASVPGFVNPFDEDKIEYFQRAAAADLLKQSGRYDKDGYVVGFKLDRGVNKANPKSGVTVNVGGSGPGLDKGRIPAYRTLLSTIKAGEDPLKSTKIDNNIKNALLTIADENSILRVKGKKVLPSMIEVKEAKDGSIGIYMKSTGDIISSISEQSFDMRVNESVGGKAVGAAASVSEPSPAKSSNIKWK